MARTRRVRISGRFYITLVMLAVLVALAIVIPRIGGGSVEAAQMEASFEPVSVIIRDESCISVKKYDMVDYLVNEGAVVNAETPIATVYKWGYTDDMTQSLVSIQQKIYDKQLKILDGIESTDLAALNAQIAELKQRIKECVADGGEGDLLAYEKDMKEFLYQRAALLKSSVQPDVELNSLYAEESTKQDQIAEYTSTVSATMTGIVSFYFDGYEQVLNAAKLDVVNADVLNKVLDGVAGSTAESSDSMLYRLVNPAKWFAVFVTPANDGLRLLPGQTYTVSFEGVHNTAFTGTALPPVSYDGGVVNMLEFSEDIGSLISARTAKAKITAPMSGFAIDAGAVKVKNGSAYINTDGGDIPVNVVAGSDDELLITGTGIHDGLRYKK